LRPHGVSRLLSCLHGVWINLVAVRGRARVRAFPRNLWRLYPLSRTRLKVVVIHRPTPLRKVREKGNGPIERKEKFLALAVVKHRRTQITIWRLL